MKKCLQIFPFGEPPINISSFGGDEQFVFDRNAIAENISDDEIIWHNLLEEHLSGKMYDVILIDQTVSDQEATIIVAHIRLSSEEIISKVPIIFYNKKKLATTLNSATLRHKDTLINCNVNYLWVDNYKDDLALVQKLKRVVDNNVEPKLVDLSLLYFRQNDVGANHQIINEWGAFLLAHEAGLDELSISLLRDNPKAKTIYFKYLRLRHNILFSQTSQTESSSNDVLKTKKYLFIDDNYEKGWLKVFDAILGQVDSELGLEAYEDIAKFENSDNENNTFDEIKNQISNNNYQGVLLDLRLTKADNNPSKLNTDIKEFTGGRLLKTIKASFPHIPVIITTASNKAWNMEQLLDEGADGYFIKQGPENLPDSNMAKENYNSLKKLIGTSQEKYRRLQPFWHFIKETERETLIEERQVSISKLDGTIKQETTKVNARIIERLYMFFGLLKRSSEDSIFNHRFHYSDNKLAFMTLWSCLNDIQYIYYDKYQSLKEIKVRDFLATKMTVASSQNLFLQTKRTTGRFQSFITVNQTSPYYSNVINNVKFDRSIGAQIAFIILLFNKGVVTDETNGLKTPHKLCDNLQELKNIRNEIYLIHGNEEEGSGFFVKKEAENIQVNLMECAKLFEIVYFLLKGTLIKIDCS